MLLNNFANFAALRRNQILRDGGLTNSTTSSELLNQLGSGAGSSLLGSTSGILGMPSGPISSVLGLSSLSSPNLAAQLAMLDAPNRFTDPSMELASLLRSQAGKHLLEFMQKRQDSGSERFNP